MRILMFWENKRESVPRDDKHEKKMLKESLSLLKTGEKTSVQKKSAFNVARDSSVVSSWILNICGVVGLPIYVSGTYPFKQTYMFAECYMCAYNTSQF